MTEKRSSLISTFTKFHNITKYFLRKLRQTALLCIKTIYVKRPYTGDDPAVHWWPSDLISCIQLLCLFFQLPISSKWKAINRKIFASPKQVFTEVSTVELRTIGFFTFVYVQTFWVMRVIQMKTTLNATKYTWKQRWKLMWARFLYWNLFVL